MNSKIKTIGIIKSGILFIGKVHFTKLSVIENLYPLYYIVIFLFVILYNFRGDTFLLPLPPLGASMRWGGGEKQYLNSKFRTFAFLDIRYKYKIVDH